MQVRKDGTSAHRSKRVGGAAEQAEAASSAARDAEPAAVVFSAPRAGWWTSQGVDIGAFESTAHLRWWLHRMVGSHHAAPLTEAEHAALGEFKELEIFSVWSVWLDRARRDLKLWEDQRAEAELAQRYCGPARSDDAAHPLQQAADAFNAQHAGDAVVTVLPTITADDALPCGFASVPSCDETAFDVAADALYRTGVEATRSDDVNADTCRGIAEADLLARMRRLGWLSSEEPLPRLTGAEGSPRPAVEVLAVLVDTAERKAFGKITGAPGTASIGKRPNDAAQSIERALKRAPEPATYQGDGEVIAAVLRRFYGDESVEMAMAVLEALRVLQRGTVRP